MALSFLCLKKMNVHLLSPHTGSSTQSLGTQVVPDGTILRLTRSIELSIYFFYWFTIYLLLHHGITCFHGTLVLNASYNLPPPSQTLLTSMILAYLKTPWPEGPGHGEQVTASAT